MILTSRFHPFLMYYFIRKKHLLDLNYNIAYPLNDILNQSGAKYNLFYIPYTQINHLHIDNYQQIKYIHHELLVEDHYQILMHILIYILYIH